MTEDRETVRICQHCRFFRDRDGKRVDKPAFEGGPANAGYCWRYPPTIFWNSTTGYIMRDRPVVSSWEWCGEYQ